MPHKLQMYCFFMHLVYTAGVSSPTAGPAGSKDAAMRNVASLAAVCDAAVQDVIDDQECYQLHFPPECHICLPSISCR